MRITVKTTRKLRALVETGEVRTDFNDGNYYGQVGRFGSVMWACGEPQKINPAAVYREEFISREVTEEIECPAWIEMAARNYYGDVKECFLAALAERIYAAWQAAGSPKP